ncbi:MAG TPA: PilZ domain-containing protein [Terriglobia bacterium]|nr:PilZ domain-containing protein [Terriglobia bacterium]
MPEPLPSERRRAVRRNDSKPLTLIVDVDRSQVTGGAFALDVSELGARVRSQLRLQPGQMITVVPREGPAEGIPSMVVWVDEGDGEKEVGLAFLQPLAAEL